MLPESRREEILNLISHECSQETHRAKIWGLLNELYAEGKFTLPTFQLKPYARNSQKFYHEVRSLLSGHLMPDFVREKLEEKVWGPRRGKGNVILRLKAQIRKRDNYTCQECGIHQKELDRALHVHHIDYNEKNNDPTNLIALCGSCHSKTNTNREYWTKHFSRLLMH